MKKEKKKELDWKKIILVNLGALAGLILLWAIGSWIFFLVTFKTYLNETDGIQISYPKTWTVKANPTQGVLVAFVSPKDNALDTFAENVNVSTYDMSKLPHSTEDYAKIMVDQLTMVFEDIKLVQKSYFPMAGQSGYRMVLKITGEEPKTIVVYAFMIETMGYNILYVGEDLRYPKDRPLLDAMALSIRVKY
jgi:hypothetical protein